MTIPPRISGGYAMSATHGRRITREPLTSRGFPIRRSGRRLAMVPSRYRQVDRVTPELRHAAGMTCRAYKWRRH